MNELVVPNNLNKLIMDAFTRVAPISDYSIGELESALFNTPPLETARKLVVNNITLHNDKGVLKLVSEIEGIDGKDLSFKILDVLC